MVGAEACIYELDINGFDIEVQGCDLVPWDLEGAVPSPTVSEEIVFFFFASVPGTPSGFNGQHHQEHPSCPLPTCLIWALSALLPELSFVTGALVSSSAAAVPLSGCDKP